MVTIAGNGGIDEVAATQFERNFLMLVQQKQSRLEASGVVRYLPTDGKYNTLPRMGKMELVEVNERNPLKQYTDYSPDNRMLRKRRFTASVLLDEKDDVNELIADPTSYIMENLIAAKNRVADRVYAAAAIGPVMVGSPNGPQSYITASQDGVSTLDATSGINYGTYTAIMQTFINKDVPMEIDNRPVDEGYMRHAGRFDTILFAGSESGGITVANPILPEGTTTRHCLVLAPQAIAASAELASLRVEKSNRHVNSKELTIDYWINAMRTEGARVIDVETTI